MSPLRKNEPSLYKVYYKFNHLNRMNTYANILYCHSLSNKLILEFFRTSSQIFKITLQIPQTGSVFAFWGISKQPLRNCPVKPSIFPAFNSIFLVTIFLVLLLQEWNNMFCFLIAGSIGNLKLINLCKNTYSNINTSLQALINSRRPNALQCTRLRDQRKEV